MTQVLPPVSSGPAVNSSRTPDPAGATAFIETQFPVSKLSKESYTERKAVAGQTLTALGKWWGRKPLVLVRAAILGLLLPASDDPASDRNVFLKLMTMDPDGLWQRCQAKGRLPARVVYEHLPHSLQQEHFEIAGGKPRWRPPSTAVAAVFRDTDPADQRKHFVLVAGVPAWAPGVKDAEKKRLARHAWERRRQTLERRAFLSMSYDQQLEHCVRPEQIDGPSAVAWEAINAHLGTSANTLPELVRELGERRFGNAPRVGDVFCGGGSIPFEAARIGCDAYASDLNPVAALLTWGALNIVGGGPDVADRVREAQARVFAAVQRQIDEWGIERNEDGWVAENYLYCNEVVDPATGWRVPLASSWVIAEKTNVIARLVPIPDQKRFEIEVIEGVSDEALKASAADGTWKDGVCCTVDESGNWLPPHRRQITSFEALRGRFGLRPWDGDDIVPQSSDIFQERLYCVVWNETIQLADGSVERVRHYRAPTPEDMERENRMITHLYEYLPAWHASGVIPSRRVEPGNDNQRPPRARGWTHWHHFFNPRQLLTIGLFAQQSQSEIGVEAIGLLLMVGRIANLNGRMCRWQVGQGGGIGGGKEALYKPALSTPPVEYACRGMLALASAFRVEVAAETIAGRCDVGLRDARTVEASVDLWITDPGYADAVFYEEVSEYFLAWYEQRLPQLFSNWYSDSRRVLAVRGKDESFRVAMLECYRRMADLMPTNGFQVVMFTHQDSQVWADLALILWAAGLQVSSAWTIGTETTAAGIRRGNYVQGTVLLVLRKRRSDDWADLSDVYPEVQAEVDRQIATLMALDPKDDPNFSDADYQLAAYAAALRVLTGYRAIGEIDVERELRRPRSRGERSELARLIDWAVRTANDALVPEGIEQQVWRRLSAEERFYLKGVEVEAHGEHREGAYQEFARSYGFDGYRSLLASGRANEVRLKTPSELAGAESGAPGFGGTLLRKVLFAVYATARHAERDPRDGRHYLRTEVADYWDSRQQIVALLRFLAQKARVEGAMSHWAHDVEAARLLLGAVENDRV